MTRFVSLDTGVLGQIRRLRAKPAILLLLVAHGLTLLRGSTLLRWRLETFGLYMPSYPHRRPWWRVNGRALRLLLGHGYEYANWLQEMDSVRHSGAVGWWRDRLGDRYDVLAKYVARENDAANCDERADTN
jgi:hypothetical protein